MLGSNTNTFGPKTVALALGAGSLRTTGATAPSTATATRIATADRVFQTITEAPERKVRSGQCTGRPTAASCGSSGVGRPGEGRGGRGPVTGASPVLIVELLPEARRSVRAYRP